jgi:hypothetical protein
MKRRKSVVGIFLLLLSLCVPAVKAQDGLHGALSRDAKTAHLLPELSSQIAAADFDNDQKPDGALLVETGVLNGTRAFQIELHLTATKNIGITFSSAETGLAISALDVNQDGAPDIIVEKAFTHQRLQVFLNDGHGAFRKVRAEDYPSPDPSAPNCRTQLSQTWPVFCLPVSRSFEMRNLERVLTLGRNSSIRLGFRHEMLLAPSPVSASASPRAPPFVLSL